MLYYTFVVLRNCQTFSSCGSTQAWIYMCFGIEIADYFNDLSNFTMPYLLKALNSNEVWMEVHKVIQIYMAATF